MSRRPQVWRPAAGQHKRFVAQATQDGGGHRVLLVLHAVVVVAVGQRHRSLDCWAPTAKARQLGALLHAGRSSTSTSTGRARRTAPGGDQQRDARRAGCCRAARRRSQPAFQVPGARDVGVGHEAADDRIAGDGRSKTDRDRHDFDHAVVMQRDDLRSARSQVPG